ncbi:conserved hypothetical protein [Sphingomonas sp. EC-HK361]|jgi:hypothetical protein|uniref:hypothetical protein n=1 Tax=Sphingomonas sp. EC-HK361 TaxID=2038397 RepID=UPI00125B0F6C|nr:hypothetical protein [Sphingomonas sp. EC-HK361]VVT13185.1 conserved hypothetical protein [Sphingomonas sp. EC-HK361]
MSRFPRPPHPDRTVSHGERRAVVGWTHNDLPRGIDLCIESAASQAGLENDRIARDHFALTHNQALLLARYLLQSTGQRLEEPSRGLLRRLFRRV